MPSETSYNVLERSRVVRSESCRAEVKKKVKLKRKSLSFRMSEGRKSQVILLDDRRLDLLVQPKLYSTELLDIVASHFNLKEKEYFGISFKDETGHHHWLHLDRKVLEHEFPKKTGPLVLYFGVRFFIESIGYLRENATIELFFLQAKQAVFKAYLEVDSETGFELAAHVLQASYGDYTEDDLAKKQLKKLPVLPTSVLREHPSIGYCEDQVLGHYRKLEGHTRGSAIVNYMTIIESIPTYGIHFYEVKDKSAIPWWLGLSYKGISLYDYADKRVPRKVFAWKQLENLYFRDKKFSIEVHDPKRVVHTLSSFNLYEDAIQEPLDEFDDLSDAISDPTTQVSVSRRTFGPGNVNVHAWFASTPLLTKCIWSMAVSQHQFYLDRKQSKSQLPQVRSMSEIATDLCHSSSSLHSGSAATSDSISRSNSAHSLTLSTYNSKTELGTDFSGPVSAEEIEASRAAQREMFHALQARKEALEEALRKKTEELKAICLKEGELTGVLPVEMPLAPGEPVPQIRRRVGTSFALSPKLMNQDKASEAEEALARLELDLDLQDKIAKAAHKLAQDKSVARSVRKQRKQQYHRAHQRLKDIEKKLNEYRERYGKIPLRLQNSMEDLSEDSREFLDSEPEFISPVGSPNVQRPNSREVGNNSYSNSYHNSPSTPQMKIIASPKFEVVELQSPSTPVSRGSNLRPPPYPSPPHPYSTYMSTAPSPQGYQNPYLQGNQRVLTNGSPGQPVPAPQHKSAPASPVRQPHGAPRGSTPSPNPGRHQSSRGYIPNSVYSTRTSYRNQTYPTYSTKDHYTGSQSDYENSSRTIPPPSNRHISRIDSENYRNETGHNLYNVNAMRTTCYDSTDELKSPGSEECDSYCSDQEGGRWQGAHHHIDHHHRAYGSLDRNIHPNMMLQELSPSKFGSKRESHSDYRDSPYQIVDMPPLPRGHCEPLREGPGNGYSRHYDHGSEDSHGDNSSHNTSIPYIDCSQSSISVPGSDTGGWYDHSRQPVPYESPPPTSYSRPEAPGYEMGHPQGSQYHPHSQHSQGYHPDAGYSQGSRPQTNYQSPPNSAQQQRTTVTKYQSYVEVSKPFEMSDFYKYSERLRKQRVQDSPPSSVSGESGPPPSYHPPPQSYPSARSQSMNPSQGQARAPVPYRGHTTSHSGYTSSTNSRSRPASPYSYQDSQPYSKNISSPYSSSSALPPAAQSSIVQTNAYKHMPVSQHSSSAYQQQSPKHVAYQPPKPMTCEPMRDNSHGSSPATSSKNLTHRYYDEPIRRNHDESLNMTFGSFNLDPGLAEAFSEEMLAWYDDNDASSPSPSKQHVPNHRTYQRML